MPAAGVDTKRGNHDARGKAAPTDRRDEAVDRYELQLAERLALLLAAEFRRRVEKRELPDST